MDTKIKSPLSRIEEKSPWKPQGCERPPTAPTSLRHTGAAQGHINSPRQPGHSWSAYLHTVYILCLINLTVSASQIVHFEPWRELT